MMLELKRDNDPQARHNYGELYANGILLGQTLEDPAREVKIDGETAIPVGLYRVILSFSNRFQRIMPEVLRVPGFTGIRIHGGNTEADTLGCPLLGTSRTLAGIANCAEPNRRLMQLLEHADENGEDVWLTVS